MQVIITSRASKRCGMVEDSSR